MDARTGEPAPADTALWARFAARYEDGDLSEQALRELAAVLFPDWTLEEARMRIVPSVPSEVRDLCEYLELFTDPGTWRELRPVIATWWC